MPRNTNLTEIGRSHADQIQDAEYREVEYTKSIIHKMWKWTKRTITGIGILSFLIVVISIATYDPDTDSTGDLRVAQQAAREADQAVNAAMNDMSADGPDGAQDSANMIGRYAVPSQCQSADKGHVIECLRGLVGNKTEVLDQVIGGRLEGASKDDSVALVLLAKKWNDTVDTVCSTQADQFARAGQGEEAQEYWACLNKFVDDRLTEVTGSAAGDTSASADAGVRQ